MSTEAEDSKLIMDSLEGLLETGLAMSDEDKSKAMALAEGTGKLNQEIHRRMRRGHDAVKLIERERKRLRKDTKAKLVGGEIARLVDRALGNLIDMINREILEADESKKESE